MPYITIIQREIPRKLRKNPLTRLLYLNVDDAIAQKVRSLSLEIVVEAGDELIAIIGTWTDKNGTIRELTRIAENIPTKPKAACVDLINEAYSRL